MIASATFSIECLLLLACHFLGDFAFQSEWMAMNKGKSWEVLVYHSATYALTFVVHALVHGTTTWGGFVALFITHFFIDACKARWGFIKRIWVDQLLHLAVLPPLLALGWM